MTLMAATSRTRTRCARCGKVADAGVLIVFRGTVTAIDCCRTHGMALASEIYTWTRLTPSKECGWCQRPALDAEEVMFRGEARYASTCSGCVSRLETVVYKWTRLGDVIARSGERSDDLAVRAERMRVVKSHKAVVPEKMKPRSSVVDQTRDQERLNQVWSTWNWRKHSIQRLVERGLTQVDGFDVRDVMSAIAFGVVTEDRAQLAAIAEGLDLRLASVKHYRGDRCVVVGDEIARNIITVWER